MPRAGEPITVIGEVVQMNDSIIGVWSEAGEFSDADRPLIEFATHYIQALQLGQGGGAAPDADSAPSGEDEGG